MDDAGTLPPHIIDVSELTVEAFAPYGRSSRRCRRAARELRPGPIPGRRLISREPGK
jgi:hypothetical protein